MKELSFDERIWQLVAAIPVGKVSSYGRIAKQAGYPNHARYVGSVLKKLPHDTRLPWYRVVNAQGRIVFAEESTQYQRQYSLLQSEGVIFKGKKVVVECHV